MSYDITGGYSLTMLVTFIKHSDSTESANCNTQTFFVCAAKGGVSVKRVAGSTDDYIRFYQKTGGFKSKTTCAGNIQYKILSTPGSQLNSLSFSKENDDITGYTRITITE